jgi:hypothetical protein
MHANFVGKSHPLRPFAFTRPVNKIHALGSHSAATSINVYCVEYLCGRWPRPLQVVYRFQEKY